MEKTKILQSLCHYNSSAFVTIIGNTLYDESKKKCLTERVNVSIWAP